MLASSSSYFYNEEHAHIRLEKAMWPAGPICPFCGAQDRIGVVRGKGARIALKFCCRCRHQFRAIMVTVLKGSHVPLHKWFQAMFLRYGCQHSITAHQLCLTLDVTYKTALCMVRCLDRATLSNREVEEEPTPLYAGESARPQLRAPRRFKLSSITRYEHQRAVEEIFTEEEVPWAIPTSSDLSGSQYRLFVEAAAALGGAKDEWIFDRILENLVEPR
jgi:Zn ribbon nucleic-acid-binding protein